MILIDRGSCTFVTKVRNVEKTGANVALIGDTRSENSEIYIMSDDGSGHTIEIPSYFLRKEASEAIKNSYKNGQRIIFKVSIETGHSNGTGNVDLWYSTPFDLSVEQLESLRDTIPPYGKSI